MQLLHLACKFTSILVSRSGQCARSMSNILSTSSKTYLGTSSKTFFFPLASVFLHLHYAVKGNVTSVQLSLLFKLLLMFFCVFLCWGLLFSMFTDILLDLNLYNLTPMYQYPCQQDWPVCTFNAKHSKHII
jgi:hypothetical protein